MRKSLRRKSSSDYDHGLGIIGRTHLKTPKIHKEVHSMSATHANFELLA